MIPGLKKFSFKEYTSVVAAVVVSFFFVALSVYSATTISSNISTGGTMSVTGLTSLIYASTTGLSVSENLMVGGNATITGATGNIATVGTLTVTGASTFTGLGTFTNASTTRVSVSGNFMVNGLATTTGSTGQFATQSNIGAGGTSTPAAELSALGTATTTLYLHSSTANTGGCIELKGTDGNAYRIYATSVASGVTAPVYMQLGSCK